MAVILLAKMNWALCRTKDSADDVAGLTDFVVAKDTDGLVLALLGLPRSGWSRGVVEGEARAFGGQQFESSLAFDAAVEVDSVHAILLRRDFHAALLRHGAERGFVAIGIKLTAGSEDIESACITIREASGRFQIIRVAADFRHFGVFLRHQMPGGGVEVVLFVQHLLRGITKGGQTRFQGRDLGRRPADAHGYGVNFKEVIVRPVHEVLGAVGDVVLAWHDGGWVESSRFGVRSSLRLLGGIRGDL